MTSLFVTGTDTEVGKSWISHGLIRLLARSGKQVVGMKPVASGCRLTRDGLRSDDALLLQQAATRTPDYELVNPYAFEPPVAPEYAATQAGVTIDPAHILRCYRALDSVADAVVVEGVGGWRVPLAGGYDVAAMAAQLALPVLLVVNVRLGCLNHARLSAESIQASGLELIGWVANSPDAVEVERATVSALERALPAPCLGVVPRLDNASQVSDYLLIS